MSYNEFDRTVDRREREKSDIFVDNCIMRLVQLAAAIRQNSDALARQEFDAIADQRDEEIDCQYFDIENNA